MNHGRKFRLSHLDDPWTSDENGIETFEGTKKNGGSHRLCSRRRCDVCSSDWFTRNRCGGDPETTFLVKKFAICGGRKKKFSDTKQIRRINDIYHEMAVANVVTVRSYAQNFRALTRHIRRHCTVILTVDHFSERVSGKYFVEKHLSHWNL